MCMSTNFIEQQAYEMCEKIKESSVFKFVGVDYLNSSGSRSQDYGINSGGLIIKIFLEDNNGSLFIIEPDSNGYRFAKGEITYSEYKKLQNKNNVYGLTIIFVILGFFSTLMILLMKYLV